METLVVLLFLNCLKIIMKLSVFIKKVKDLLTIVCYLDQFLITISNYLIV